jgi:hypothetical protein
LPPFSGAWSVIHQLAPCCQHVVMFCWLFFNFAVLFDFGCFSLAQEMSFLYHCLPSFKQWLITNPLAALLPFHHLFTEVHMEISSLPYPLLWCTFSILPALLCVSFQSLVYCSGFYFGGVSLPKWLCWFIPGVARGIPHDAWCSPVWSAECLPSRFGVDMWWWREPSSFLSVTCCAEAF